MSADNARKLVDRLANDPAFRERLKSTPQAQRQALLESHGFGDVTAEEVNAAVASVSSAELTDDDLENVAGGTLEGWSE